jgi:hypothetical protein
MGYYDQSAVPVFDSFARCFAIRDNWFSPLPAGTQINRLMAMSGERWLGVGFPDADQHWYHQCMRRRYLPKLPGSLGQLSGLFERAGRGRICCWGKARAGAEI